MDKDVRLSEDEVERLVDLLRDQLKGVQRGDIVSDQPVSYDVEDITHILWKLER